MYRKALAFLIAAVPLAAAPLAAQTPIRVGQTVAGSLDAEDPRLENGAPYDTYVIQGRPGERVLVRMRSEAFDAYLRWGFREADGVWYEEASNDDGGEGTDSRLVVTLGTEGKYELRASSFGEEDSGAYELELAQAVAPRAVRLSVGEPVEGALAESDYEGDNGPEDHFLLAGRPGDVVTIFAESDEFDTYLAAGAWNDGNFSETASDDDGGAGTNSQLVVEMGDAREVYVILRSFSGESAGGYTLRVEPGAAEPVEDEEGEWEDDEEGDWADGDTVGIDIDVELVGTFVGAVQAGADVQGTLGEAGAEGMESVQHYREYSYRAAAGERFTITVTADELDPYVGIGTGRGDEYAAMAEDDDGGEELNALLEFEAPEAATYTIRVTSAFPGQTGPFVLRVESGR
jgi:hypothetical protein